jgi:hypothetical protein
MSARKSVREEETEWGMEKGGYSGLGKGTSRRPAR